MANPLQLYKCFQRKYPEECNGHRTCYLMRELKVCLIRVIHLLCGKRIPSIRVPEMMARVRYVNLSCGMKPAPPGKFSEPPDC